MKQLKRTAKLTLNSVFDNLNFVTSFHCVKYKDNPFYSGQIYIQLTFFATVVRTVNKGSLNVLLLF